MRITAKDVPCPVCKVSPSARCVYIWHTPMLGKPMASYHEKRAQDAHAAESAANILLDDS